MNERKKYTAFSIPPRETQPAKEMLRPVQDSLANTVLLSDTFAEIEFEFRSTAADDTRRRFFSPAAPAQALGNRAADHIRQTFYSMRGFALGNPVPRHDAVLFYKQAKYMEGFTDDYQENAQFSMFYPFYHHMGYEQLRTYFTWRTKIRNGEILPVSLSYIFLYIYELLSNIGVDNPDDGLDKLMTLWNALDEPVLDNFLPGWLKDYHIYYRLPHSFEEFAQNYGLRSYYPELFALDAGAENSLALWNGISSYDITKSKFYNAGNELLLKRCFNAVLCGVRELCESRNIGIENFLYSICERAPWYPFKRALFYHWLVQPDRRVDMPGREIYYCDNNRWTASIAIENPDKKELAGYLIKKMELCLRQAVKYKFKIKADPSGVYRPFQRSGIPVADLDKAIEKTVADFHRDMSRIVVTVKHDNLTRIRKEALGTQDKLVVPEDVVPALPVEAAPVKALRAEQPVPVSDGWAALKYALSNTELKTLSLVLQGGTGIKAYADENDIMLEVLADSINEKAVDHIGDSILETDENLSIYEEYRAKIKEMVG